MRALYIIGSILSVVFAFVTFYYLNEYLRATWTYIQYYGDDLGDSWKTYKIKITATWAMVSILFFFFYIAMDILGLVKIKSKTTKVLSIIGLSITGVMLSWDLVVMSSPFHISVDEVGGVWLFYAFIYFVFSIVGVIQAVKWRNRNKVKANDQILDDLLNEEY